MREWACCARYAGVGQTTTEQSASLLQYGWRSASGARYLTPQACGDTLMVGVASNDSPRERLVLGKGGTPHLAPQFSRYASEAIEFLNYLWPSHS
jgi:hypothetical protein